MFIAPLDLKLASGMTIVHRKLLIAVYFEEFEYFCSLSCDCDQKNNVLLNCRQHTPQDICLALLFILGQDIALINLSLLLLHFLNLLNRFSH